MTIDLETRTMERWTSASDGLEHDPALAELDLDEIDALLARAPAHRSPPVAADRPSPLGSLVHRPGLWARNGIRFITVRRWRARAKTADLQAFRDAKCHLDPALIEAAAGELSEVLRDLLGPAPGYLVTNVACGHSRRPDCFGKRLAQAAAVLVGVPYVQVFADRFVRGSSHPRQVMELPPLRRIAIPDRMCVVVDDLATSGWHLEEALGNLRSQGVPALGLAWLGGIAP